MADESFQERTERATPKRREEARRRGQVARSQELVSIFALAAGLVALNALGPSMVERLAGLSRLLFRDPLAVPVTVGTLPGVARGLMAQVGVTLLPFTLVVGAVGIAASVAQTGFLVSTESVAPKWERLNPITRIKGYLSLRGGVEAAKAVLKVAIVTAVAYAAVRGEMDRLFGFFWGTTAASYGAAWAIAFRIGMKILALLFALAVFDAAYQRWQFERDIRMSRDELKEEHRQQEGDPMVKARVRSIQRDIARRRMMAAVRTADVVVTNPTHVAVALRYDGETMGAPVVVAKGMRRVAERIKQVAREHGVPVVESPALARGLHKAVRLGGTVPVALYRAVAEILALAYRIKARAF
jgi:flagellar biosynthetic protein FlhB